MTYTIETGEYKIDHTLGVFRHITIDIVSEDGSLLEEINGLATNRFGQPKPVGFAVLGDKIKVHIFDEASPGNGNLDIGLIPNGY